MRLNVIRVLNMEDIDINSYKNHRFGKVITWCEKHITERNLLLILSFVIGLLTAFAGLVLKWLIHFIQGFLTDNFDKTGANWLYLLYPVIGIFLTGLFVRFFVRDDISHGITKILYAISVL